MIRSSGGLHQAGKVKSAATRGPGGSWLGSAPRAGVFSGFQYPTPPLKIHDATIREAFDLYQAQRVNIYGDKIGYDPDSPAASAEWVKHNLNRIRDSLPNGYCGRPAQQDCPHPNACLTCPDFQTTPVFLEIHRRQAATNRTLIAQADGKGQQRHAENLRRVQANLERIIPVLEALESEGPADGTR